VAWPAIEKLNNAKAALLYSEIDNNPLFTGTVVKEDRSKMNVCFVMNDPALKLSFYPLPKKEILLV
jgi:phosphoserine aminotransferase